MHVALIAIFPDQDLDAFLALLRAWESAAPQTRHLSIGVDAPQLTVAEALIALNALEPRLQHIVVEEHPDGP